MKGVKFVHNFVNRNPRNLDRLRLQPKPSGYSFERDRERMNAVYRIEFSFKNGRISASIIHYSDGEIVSASSGEKSVSAQLFSRTDVSAAYNVGKLLAYRCAMTGISSCKCFTPQETMGKGKRKANFLQGLKDGGFSFEELETIPHNHLNDAQLTWDPFISKPTRESKLDELDLALEPGKGVC